MVVRCSDHLPGLALSAGRVARAWPAPDSPHMGAGWHRWALLWLMIFAVGAFQPNHLFAEDVSSPALLQLFEARWATIEDRMVDLFYAGYGGLWTPPPGRADTGPLSVGYDVFDRFDLGRPRAETLYGTEAGLKGVTAQAHRAGVQVYTDLVLNHNGFGNRTDAGFVALGGYPGFALTLPEDINGDFHDPSIDFGSDPVNGRLAGLIDIAHETNHRLIRHPVDPNQADNIPAGALFNRPDPANRRFYPDRDAGGVPVVDPRLGTGATLYDFNPSDPARGDAIPENALGLLMRNARWLVQTVGVDGFRIDAAKHMPPWVLDYLDQAVFRANPRRNLDGTIRPVFSFSEVFDGNRATVQSYLRKDLPDPRAIATSNTTVGGNRDVLDFPLFFALRDHLTSNGLANNWHAIRNASIDANDGLANDGSQGVAFVGSHDQLPGGFPFLENVAYAYTLLRPGNALVYMNAHEFGDQRSFPGPGRDDALGGPDGDTIARLVGIRNSYGRGDFAERWIDDAFNPHGFSNVYVYERRRSILVGLNSRNDALIEERTGIQTDFAPGTVLVELTGNATDPLVDPGPGDAIPAAIRVDGSGRVTLRIPGNDPHGKGYVVYGPAAPQGTLAISPVAQVLAGATPPSGAAGTARLGTIDVITSDTFQVRLETAAVVLPAPAGEADPVRDRDADGDAARLRIDGGIDLNGDRFPGIDDARPGSVTEGFERFTEIDQPGFGAQDGTGRYQQSIDASRLAEGRHFVTVRAFRHRDPASGGDGGPAIYRDFRRAIYVDRLPPEAEIVSFEPFASAPDETANRDLIARSIDQTADNMHLLLDLPAAVDDDAVLTMALAGKGNAGRDDRDAWIFGFTGVTSGNHVATVVTFEPTGNFQVQRFPGQFTQTSIGAGLGDVNADGVVTADDLRDEAGAGTFEEILTSHNTQFNPAADLNGDGLVDNRDLFDLKDRLLEIGAGPGTWSVYQDVLHRRGDVNRDGLTDALDIDWLFANLGGDPSQFDLNVDGLVTSDDVKTLVVTMLGTSPGDLDLGGQVNHADLQVLKDHLGQAGVGWAGGDLDGNGQVNEDDLNLLLAHFILPGDLDIDGDVDFDDIDGLVLGLTDPLAYQATHGVPAELRGDTDGDGDLDFDDVGGFVHLLEGGNGGQAARVPEPSAALLASLGLFAVVVFGRHAGVWVAGSPTAADR